MQLFFNASLTDVSTELTFDRSESRHIIKVLRKKEGDLLHISNGENLLFKAVITSANDKKCIVKIQEVIPQKQNREYKIQIAIAPTKNNSRFEWFLEKATEIGIDAITPILCEHSERRQIKQDRMQKVIQTATKQSLQYSLPELHQMTSYKEYVSRNITGQKFIAQSDSEGDEMIKKNLQSLINKGSDVCILIGPEGGFSPNEINLALQNDYIPVSLGNTRLRTETAGIVAVNTVTLVNE